MAMYVTQRLPHFVPLSESQVSERGWERERERIFYTRKPSILQLKSYIVHCILTWQK